MASYYICMDQSLVTDLRRHKLCSAQFSTCAPIVLYNRNTHRGALFHLGGGDLEKDSANILLQLKSLLTPTDVYILCGLGAYDFGTFKMNIMKNHVLPVSAIFQGNCTIHTVFEGKSTYGSISVTVHNGALLITAESDPQAQTLKTSANIDSLPDDLTLMGERDDAKLAKWL